MRAAALALAVALLPGPAQADEAEDRAAKAPVQLSPEDLELLQNLELLVEWELLREWDPATPPMPGEAGSGDADPAEEEDQP